MAIPARNASRGDRGRNGRVHHANFAASGPVGTEDAARDLGAAAAHEAVEAHDLAFGYVERDIPEAAGTAEAAQRQQLAPEFRDPAGKDVLQRAADHEADQLVALGVARIHGGNKRTVLEHRDPVGNLVQFVEAMRDIEDQHIFIAEPPDECEELRQVLLRKHGRGLVHDQDARFHCHGFGDLHDLALRRAEAGHTPPHIDPLKPDVLQDLLHAVVRGPPVYPPAEAARRHIAEQDVLRDAEVGYQVGVLSHHADAELMAA